MRPTDPLPVDPALPQLSRLLDADEMAPILRRLARPDEALSSVRVNGLRYSPGLRLLVHYGVRIGGEWHSVTAFASGRSRFGQVVHASEARALVRAVASRSPAVTALTFDQKLQCVIQWMPLDLRMPALAQQGNRLRRLLRGAGVNIAPTGAEPAILRYRPLGRASFRLGRHFVKIYGREGAFAAFANAVEVASGRLPFASPRVEAVVPKLRLVVQSLLPGRPPTRNAEVAAAAGALASTLHRTGVDGLPPAHPSWELLRVARAERVLLAIAPDLRTRVGKLVARLEADAPSPSVLVPSHGDFTAGQLLERRRELALVDLDSMCLAPPALDLATFAGHFVLGGKDDLSRAAQVLEDLVEGYGDRPPDMNWYLTACILRRAHRPFRRLEWNWHERVGNMVDAAEGALQL
jgi:Phosphotransferase enzyme family